MKSVRSFANNLGITTALWFTGCAVDSAHIQITERPNTLETRRYQEVFDEAYYDLDLAGKLRLVVRKRQPASLDGDELTQTIVVESVWRPIPGTTISDRTQINGTVMYVLEGRRIVQSLAGAGSIFYYENDAKDRLTGTLAHVTLESLNPETSHGFLERIELSGDFSAHRDACRAIRTANEIRSMQQVATSPKSTRG